MSLRPSFWLTKWKVNKNPVSKIMPWVFWGMSSVDPLIVIVGDDVD